MYFCKYKNLFGPPETGVHKYRFFGFALFDLCVTLFLAFLIGMVWKIDIGIIFTLLWISSILVHYLFCVETKTMKLLKWSF